MTIAEELKHKFGPGACDLYPSALFNQTHRMIKDDRVTVFFEDGSSLTFKKVFQLED